MQERQSETDILGAEHDLPPYDGPVRPYLVCSSTRSGSSVLCEMLSASGVLGRPDEYLQFPRGLTRLAERFGTRSADGSIDMRAYLDALGRHRATANGVCGIKVHFFQLLKVAHIAAVRELVLGAALVWLRRRDTLGQAISLMMARRTGKFSAVEDAGDGEADPDLPFDQIALYQAWGGILVQDRCWEVFFAENGRAPLEVWYEDMLADPDAVGRAIAAHVGAVPSAPFSLATVRRRRQDSATKEAWNRAVRAGFRVRV